MFRSYLFASIFVISRVLDKVPFLGPVIAPFKNNTNPAALWLLVLLAWIVPAFLELRVELLETH